MGPVQLVGEGLVAVALELARFVGHGLLGVENRCMVELGEGVDEELPVAPDVGAVLVDLGHLVEGVAVEASAELPRGTSANEVVLSGSRFTKMNPSQVSACTEARP